MFVERRSMSRPYAALRLLEHGPLSLEHFAMITGWPYRACQNILNQLLDTGSVIRAKHGIYQLAP